MYDSEYEPGPDSDADHDGTSHGSDAGAAVSTVTWMRLSGPAARAPVSTLSRYMPFLSSALCDRDSVTRMCRRGQQVASPSQWAFKFRVGQPVPEA